MTEKNMNAPEPAPTEGNGAEVWPLLIADLKRIEKSDAKEWLEKDMLDRHAMGIKKYGVPLRVWNGRDAVVDAYQEGLDGLVYVRQAGQRAKEHGKLDELHILMHISQLFAEATTLLGRMLRNEEGYSVPKEPPP